MCNSYQATPTSEETSINKRYSFKETGQQYVIRINVWMLSTDPYTFVSTQHTSRGQQMVTYVPLSQVTGVQRHEGRRWRLWGENKADTLDWGESEWFMREQQDFLPLLRAGQSVQMKKREAPLQILKVYIIHQGGDLVTQRCNRRHMSYVKLWSAYCNCSALARGPQTPEGGAGGRKKESELPLQIRLSCRWMEETVEGPVQRAVPKGRGSACQKGQFSAWLHSSGAARHLRARSGGWRRTPFLSISHPAPLSVTAGSPDSMCANLSADPGFDRRGRRSALEGRGGSRPALSPWIIIKPDP